MITRIHSASVVVSDQQAALKWYTDVLGWEVRINQPMGGMDFITVAPKGSSCELSLSDPRMMAQAGGDFKPGLNMGISIVCKDVQATFEDLKAKGVVFPMEPTDMPWGAKGAHFADLDGNIFFLTEDQEAYENA